MDIKMNGYHSLKFLFVLLVSVGLVACGAEDKSSSSPQGLWQLSKKQNYRASHNDSIVVIDSQTTEFMKIEIEEGLAITECDYTLFPFLSDPKVSYKNNRYSYEYTYLSSDSFLADQPIYFTDRLYLNFIDGHSKLIGHWTEWKYGDKYKEDIIGKKISNHVSFSDSEQFQFQFLSNDHQVLDNHKKLIDAEIECAVAYHETVVDENSEELLSDYRYFFFETTDGHMQLATEEIFNPNDGCNEFSYECESDKDVDISIDHEGNIITVEILNKSNSEFVMIEFKTQITQ